MGLYEALDGCLECGLSVGGRMTADGGNCVDEFGGVDVGVVAARGLTRSDGDTLLPLQLLEAP